MGKKGILLMTLEERADRVMREIYGETWRTDGLEGVYTAIVNAIREAVREALEQR